VELREEFVLRAKGPNANVAELCREYGISRKTAYKWLHRFERGGVAALQDMSRRPRRFLTTSGEVVLRILEIRAAHARWGPKKVRVLLLRERAEVPSVKTIARVLERLGQPKLRRRSPTRVVDRHAPKHDVRAPNDLWTVDFKGWWRTKDGKRCEPLTVRDALSRFILCLKILSSVALAGVRPVFERLFEQYGLPRTIHVDNGSPFGSTSARCGLTKLSAWWVSLGIKVVFSRPAHPQDNGAHERMHRDISVELERRSARSLVAQQRRCDVWVEEFNHVRPHEALANRCPGELYKRSTRRYAGPRAPRYPASFAVRTVPKQGSQKYNGKEFFVGSGFAGFSIGIEHLTVTLIKIWFYEVDLGTVDLTLARDTRRVPPKAASAEARMSLTTLTKQMIARAGARAGVAIPSTRPTLTTSQSLTTTTSTSSPSSPRTSRSKAMNGPRRRRRNQADAA